MEMEAQAAARQSSGERIEDKYAIMLQNPALPEKTRQHLLKMQKKRLERLAEAESAVEVGHAPMAAAAGSRTTAVTLDDGNEGTADEAVMVAELTADLPLLGSVYRSAAAVCGRSLPAQCSPRLRPFFEGAEGALETAVGAAAQSRTDTNSVGSLPGAWLAVLAKLEAAIAVSTAQRVIVRRHDNGFFANFLQVLDGLAAAARPGVNLEIVS